MDDLISRGKYLSTLLYDVGRACHNTLPNYSPLFIDLALAKTLEDELDRVVDNLARAENERNRLEAELKGQTDLLKTGTEAAYALLKRLDLAVHALNERLGDINE